MNRKNLAAVAGLSVLVGLATATAGYAALRLSAAARLARDSHPFARLAEREGARLLVIGDSTAEGTGASAPEYSVPGLLARANPSLTVVNRARDGTRFEAFLDQLDGMERGDRWCKGEGNREKQGSARHPKESRRRRGLAACG